MKVPHKHAALIREWADGAEIQLWNVSTQRWVDCETLLWREDEAYRVKPIPKPDIVWLGWMPQSPRATHWQMFSQHMETGDANVRVTYDGETFKLKKVEML